MSSFEKKLEAYKVNALILVNNFGLDYFPHICKVYVDGYVIEIMARVMKQINMEQPLLCEALEKPGDRS